MESPKESIPETTEMKLEDILNDLYKKIEHIHATIGFILEKTNLLDEIKK